MKGQRHPERRHPRTGRKVVLLREWEDGRKVTTWWACDGGPGCYLRGYLTRRTR